MATIAEQTVIDELTKRKVKFDHKSIRESSSGRIVELPNPLIKLIRQEDGWTIFDCKQGNIGGGDSIAECIEALYS